MKLRTRSFFKLVGTSVGVGVASQVLSPLRLAFADQVAQNPLVGPADQSFTLESQNATSLTNHAFDFTILPNGSPNGTNPTSLMNLRTDGTLDLNNGWLINVAYLGSTTMYGALDLSGFSLLNVGYIGGKGTSTIKIGSNVESLSIIGTAVGGQGGGMAPVALYVEGATGGGASGSGVAGGFGGMILLSGGQGGAGTNGATNGAGGQIMLQPGSPGDGTGGIGGDWGAVVLAPSGGNVGIGTAGPLKPLDVAASGGIRISQTADASAANELYFQDNGQIRSFDDTHRIIFDRANGVLELRESGNLVFSPGATAGNRTQMVTFTSDGNVGIGVTSPNA